MYLLVWEESRDHQVGNKIFSWGHWDMPLLSLLSQECQLKWSVICGTETVLFVSVWLYEAFGFMFCWWQFSSWWCLYLILRVPSDAKEMSMCHLLLFWGFVWVLYYLLHCCCCSLSELHRFSTFSSMSPSLLFEILLCIPCWYQILELTVLWLPGIVVLLFALWMSYKITVFCFQQVKPAMPYLDVIRLLRDNSSLPVSAYQVGLSILWPFYQGVHSFFVCRAKVVFGTFCQ